jgi:hypothetical protein
VNELGEIILEGLMLVGAVIIGLLIWSVLSNYLPLAGVNKVIGVAPQA